MGAAAPVMMGVQAAGSYYNGRIQAAATRAEADYQTQVATQNAGLAQQNADDAISRGEFAANKYGAQVKQMVGTQRATLAANGIAVDAGVGADIQMDTELAGVQAQTQIKTNAWREAYGYKIEKNNILANDQLNQLAAGNKSKNTLLTSGLQAFGFGAQGLSQGFSNSGGFGGSGGSKGSTAGGSNKSYSNFA